MRTKRRLIGATVLLLVCASHAAEVRLQNGTVLTGEVRYVPSQVEVTTARGKVMVPFSQLTPESRGAFSNAPELELEKMHLRLKSQEIEGNQGTPMGVASPADESLGAQWKIDLSRSPIDDSETIMARTVALHDGDIYGRGKRPSLVARWKEGSMEVFLNFGQFLGSSGKAQVTIRYDREVAGVEQWSFSSDRESVFAPSGEDSLRRLLKHERMVVRITPYGENPVTAEFDLRGLSKAAPALIGKLNGPKR